MLNAMFDLICITSWNIKCVSRPDVSKRVPLHSCHLPHINQYLYLGFSCEWCIYQVPSCLKKIPVMQASHPLARRL